MLGRNIESKSTALETVLVLKHDAERSGQKNTKTIMDMFKKMPYSYRRSCKMNPGF